MSRPRTLLASFGALALGLVALAAPAGAADPESQASAAAAVAWLRTQQQPDGGFEVSGFPGFETPDAVLAIAEAAQTGSTWSSAEALAGVQAVTNSTGLSGLDALDTFAASGLDAGQAAKLIVLDAVALGLDPAAFDPAGDGSPVDLTAIVAAGAQPDGSYGAFNATLFAALASYLTSGSVPASTVTLVRAAQQSNGAWGFAGDPSGTDEDPDTTGLAVQALVAGGATAADPDVAEALAFLAGSHQADGSWPSPFDTGNPNSTALGIQAVTAAGYDPTSSCWRDAADPAQAGSAYSSPDAYLRGAQTAAGNIASPNDSFGLNTFATSQAVQALLRGWLPVARVAAQPCAPTATSTTSTTTPTTTAVQVLGGSTTRPQGTLPNTGTATTALALGGLLALAAGGAAVLGARRRSRA